MKPGYDLYVRLFESDGLTPLTEEVIAHATLSGEHLTFRQPIYFSELITRDQLTSAVFRLRFVPVDGFSVSQPHILVSAIELEGTYNISSRASLLAVVNLTAQAKHILAGVVHLSVASEFVPNSYVALGGVAHLSAVVTVEALTVGFGRAHLSSVASLVVAPSLTAIASAALFTSSNLSADGAIPREADASLFASFGLRGVSFFDSDAPLSFVPVGDVGRANVMADSGTELWSRINEGPLTSDDDASYIQPIEAGDAYALFHLTPPPADLAVVTGLRVLLRAKVVFTTLTLLSGDGWAFVEEDKPIAAIRQP